MICDARSISIVHVLSDVTRVMAFVEVPRQSTPTSSYRPFGIWISMDVLAHPSNKMDCLPFSPGQNVWETHPKECEPTQPNTEI